MATPVKPPQVPPPTVLRGRHVLLEPLTAQNAPELAAVLARPETFAGGWGGGPAAATQDPEEFTAFLHRYSLAQQRPFLVRLHDGRAAGTTTLSEFEPDKERLHLGWTAYAPQVWGSVVNAECKLLLLDHVFAHGWGRVRIQADILNERSRRAIAGIGASFEGIVRRDQRRADGSWRDAAVFSVIVEEWPQVRIGLQRRVDDWDEARPLWSDR